MMLTKRLIIDLDGVCCEFNREFNWQLEEACGYLNISIPSDVKFDTWNWDTKYYDQQVVKAAWHYVKNADPAWWRKLAPLHGVKKLAALIDDGVVDPVFLTNRNFPTAEWQSIKWLEHQDILDVPVLSVQDKATVAAGLRFDAVIDDNPRNIKGFLSVLGAGPTSPKIYLLKAPWNAEVHDLKYIHPVESLEEFLTKEGF